jgi:hypothetical protein
MCDESSILLNRVGCILSYGGRYQDIAINYVLLALNLVYCSRAFFTNANEDVVHEPTAPATINPTSEPHAPTDRGAPLSDQNNTARAVRKRHVWCAVASFFFVVTFQIVLCLVLACSGISIVWCAMLGWIISEERSTLVTNQFLQQQQVVSIRHDGNQSQSELAGGTDMASEDDATMSLTAFMRDRQIAEPSPINVTSIVAKKQARKRLIVFVVFVDSASIVYYGVVAEPITTVAHACAIVLGALLSLLSLELIYGNQKEGVTWSRTLSQPEHDNTATTALMTGVSK